MRPLSNSEKKLASILVFLGIAYLHAWGYKEWSTWKKNNNQLEIDLIAEKNAAEIWLEKKDLWEQRQKYLTDTQPLAKEPGMVNSELNEQIKKIASETQVNITDTVLQPTKALPHAFQATATIKFTGKFENVVQWLYHIQAPDKFMVISKSVIKSDANPPQVLGEIEVSRWYQPNPQKP